MKRKEIIKKEIPYVFLIVLALIICIPFTRQDLDITRDDGIQHICRLIGTLSSIEEGQVFPVIMPSFCNGFGYNWNTFYSPFTAIVPLIFRLFTTDYIVMLKLFLFGATLASGITMFWFAKTFTKSEKAGLIIAGLYMLAPYHLTDLYIRVAVAEFTAFVFIPLVFLGLYHLCYGEKQKSFFLVIGAVRINSYPYAFLLYGRYLLFGVCIGTL